MKNGPGPELLVPGRVASPDGRLRMHPRVPRGLHDIIALSRY
jgi:hypothetical protein